MKKKHYYIMNTIKYGLLSLFFLIGLFIFGDGEIEFRIMAIIIGIIFSYLFFKSFKKIKEPGIIDNKYKPADDASEYDKIKFYKRMIYMSIVAFPILSYFNFDDITNFENGKADYLNLWWPVAFAYEKFGYWAGVVFVPVLGIIVIVGFFIVIKNIKWKHNKNNTVLIKRY